jgi:hypothetical protein
MYTVPFDDYWLMTFTIEGLKSKHAFLNAEAKSVFEWLEEQTGVAIVDDTRHMIFTDEWSIQGCMLTITDDALAIAYKLKFE